MPPPAEPPQDDGSGGAIAAGSVSDAHPDPTPTGTLSLRDLRRQLLQRAATTAAKARACRLRGDLRTARLLEQQAQRMLDAARSVQVPS
jgi:hypothetical protein